ncbi:phosphatase PAP2 family protein [Leekyejoonella antrihumi]|uniref:Phosphatase PAP2 family protein n=1 Tax=Leekyejoonella antrihumi TaxID=1660198 RepID=A0A563DU97_9MICO|nr:phosphatase PAP2 family protein [Leekyejoonella antrihumi]TWP33492.1 phosphatase PAP2 family protein [Leekyejoonella antrihumi]
MVQSTVWFIVLVLSVAALLCAVDLSTERGFGRRFSSVPRRLITAVASGVLLIALALIWRVHAVAAADGHVIAKLDKSRGAALTGIMNVVTTMGDAIPSLLIASALALIVYRQRQNPLAVLIPLAVLVELLIQAGMTKAFHDITVHQVTANLVIGGTGTIPSGSVARLYAVFLLTSHLWNPKDPAGKARIATLGAVLVLIQLTTRLFLARHLLADIVGGLLLGLVLERIGTVVIMWRASSPRLRNKPAASDAGDIDSGRAPDERIVPRDRLI